MLQEAGPSGTELALPRDAGMWLGPGFSGTGQLLCILGNKQLKQVLL